MVEEDFRVLSYGTSSERHPGDHLTTWPLLSNEHHVHFNTPSQLDGWTPAQEITVRKKAARVIFDTAKAHGVSAGTSAVAVTMFLRFYCRRSMVKNHPFVMALASLFLACKSNDNPRALRGLQVEMLKQWYGRDSPELRERLDEVDKMEKLRETAMRAETMLLMALDFDLNIDVLLFAVVKIIKEIPELRGFKDAKVQQKLVNVCNDIMRNDGTFVLVYSYEKLAVAICHFFCQKDKTLTVPPNNVDGSHWYERFALTVEEMETISERLIKMYKKINKEKSKATTTTSSGGYAASVRGGAVRHAPAAAAAAQIQPQSRAHATASRVGSLSKSGSPAVTHAVLKRPRSEPEIGTQAALQEAFRSQEDMYETQYAGGYDAQYTDLDMSAGYDGGYNGGYSVQHTQLTQPTQRMQMQVDYGDLPPGKRRGQMPAAVAPAAKPDASGPPSSPEEGELGLEEGEIA